MGRYFKELACFVAGISCCVTICAASAQTTAITTGTLSAGGNSNTYEFGFRFTVNTPISVTSLGAFDAGSNGLSQSHVVSIWNTGGTVLASTTISGGNAASAQNGFQYATVTPLNLNSGTYVIGASNYSTGGDNFAMDSSRTVASQITLNTPLYSVSSTSTMPTTSTPDTLFYGANFQFVATGPEPSTWLLMGVGMFGAGAMLRRRSASTFASA